MTQEMDPPLPGEEGFDEDESEETSLSSEEEEEEEEEEEDEEEEEYEEGWEMAPWYYEEESEDSLIMKMHIYQRGTMFHNSSSRWLESKLPTTWCLDLTPHESGLDEILDAMETALSLGHIDVLHICNMISCLGQEEVQGLIQELMELDRDWKVLYSIWEDDYDVELCLNTLKLLKPIKYLQLITTDFIPDKMLPILKTFPNLQVLDLSWVPMKPQDLITWYQDEFWARKLPYFSLTYGIGAPLHFPPAASQHLHTFKCYLDPSSKSVFPGWVRQLSRLEHLRHLHVNVRGRSGRIEYAKQIQALATWLSSPSCRLSHFSFGIYNYMLCEPLTLVDSLSLMQAIGKNRSIRQVCLTGLSHETDWSSDVFPQLAKSSIHHLALGEKEIQKSLLVDWMVQMRPIRYVTTDALEDFQQEIQLFRTRNHVTYLSHLHCVGKRCCVRPIHASSTKTKNHRAKKNPPKKIVPHWP